MRTVTATTLVLMGEHSSLTLNDFETATGERLVNALTFYDKPLGSYAVVGEATITLTLHDTEGLKSAKVEQLKAKLQNTQAVAEVKCNQIREQINSLLALEYKP